MPGTPVGGGGTVVVASVVGEDSVVGVVDGSVSGAVVGAVVTGDAPVVVTASDPDVTGAEASLGDGAAPSSLLHPAAVAASAPTATIASSRPAERRPGEEARTLMAGSVVMAC